jgi:hypothetical protein
VASFCNTEIENILREFDFMNPVHYLVSTSIVIKQICNMILIKILANSFAQIEFCAKVSKKIKGTNFLTINSMAECTNLSNKLLDNGINIPNYQILCETYPTDAQRILNWFPSRYKNKASRLVNIITMMCTLIIDQKKLFCDKNEYAISSNIDVMALIGNNLSLEKMTPKHIDHTCFYNYKLIENLVKNNTYADNIEPIIITSLIMPICHKTTVCSEYTNNIVIEI